MKLLIHSQLPSSGCLKINQWFILTRYWTWDRFCDRKQQFFPGVSFLSENYISDALLQSNLKKIISQTRHHGPTIVEFHYRDVIMDTMASQITSLTVVYLTVYSDADQRKHQSSALLAFVWGIHRGPVSIWWRHHVTAPKTLFWGTRQVQSGAVITWSFFLTNINKIYPIARSFGRGMGCLLWIQHLIDILPEFL